MLPFLEMPRQNDMSKLTNKKVSKYGLRMGCDFVGWCDSMTMV